ncbi:MAG: GTPase Era [Gammaproteobacteria bacterium]|nr:GTPase Era [Gammaproteobacteria bacterium]MDH3535523.1 GTPase Era [Gammaproteobacteria bacterium]
MNDGFRCGYVALVGKPNTGKSTLMNALVGEKLSITAHRPQTTRHQILGIKTSEEYQCIFVDTPGIHDNNSKAIHRYMNRAATSMLDDADLICVLLDITHYNRDDEKILQRVGAYKNLLLVVNKVDKLSREDCLPVMQKISQQAPAAECVPVSALTGDNLDRLQRLIVSHLPVAVPHFPDDQLTDKSMRFISAEIVREKLFRVLKQELPYSITVAIDHYIEEPDITRISATIWVERKSQKAIVIGKGGSLLKKIGSLARGDIERLVGSKVYLQLWVKVRAEWSDDEQALAAFGYSDGNQSL